MYKKVAEAFELTPPNFDPKVFRFEKRIKDDWTGRENITYTQFNEKPEIEEGQFSIARQEFSGIVR